jgi:uncharacterized membrane protein
MRPVLLLGESWFIHSIHQKGFDSFETSEYVEGAGQFIQAMRDQGLHVDYVPAHRIESDMPTDAEGLDRYGCIVLSDVGANTFLLSRQTFGASIVGPNRLVEIARYVDGGGGLVMVGGYMSFSGIAGKARYGSSPLGPVLPVEVLPVDDRVERPEGVVPVVRKPHPIVDGLPSEWPLLLGYNRVTPKRDAVVLATCGDDPLLVVGEHGRGRTVAFTSDLAPHWAPPGFVEWPSYGSLWGNILRWASAERETAPE